MKISLEIPLIFFIVSHQGQLTDMIEKREYNQGNISGQNIIDALSAQVLASFSQGKLIEHLLCSEKKDKFLFSLTLGLVEADKLNTVTCFVFKGSVFYFLTHLWL